MHRKKVEDVRRWLVEAFDNSPTAVLSKYRVRIAIFWSSHIFMNLFQRILALTGNAGTGKTATLQVLAREMDFDILEWRNSPDDNFSWDGDIDYGLFPTQIFIPHDG